MAADQRFAARRPDVLVYQTEPLEEDLTIAGPITASLSVSTTGTDADWVVKLIDVYPDDYPLQPGEATGDARGRPARRWAATSSWCAASRSAASSGRASRSRSRSSPGQVAKVEFTMPDVFHTFRRGHRIMVQVQSSWFPLVDRNPQTFVNINEATEATSGRRRSGSGARRTSRP